MLTLSRPAATRSGNFLASVTAFVVRDTVFIPSIFFILSGSSNMSDKEKTNCYKAGFK